MSDAMPGLGTFQLCLNVKDVSASETFYRTLGFTVIGGEKAKGYLILRRDDCEIGIFKGHIPKNLMNFRGGHIGALLADLKGKGVKFSKEVPRPDGSGEAIAEDPDGNILFFDSSPEEVESYRKSRGR